MNTPDATSVQQDNPQVQRDPEYQHSQDSYGTDNIAGHILHHPGDTQQTETNQNSAATNSPFKEIPELKEQFTDTDDQLINRHNTHQQDQFD